MGRRRVRQFSAGHWPTYSVTTLFRIQYSWPGFVVARLADCETLERNRHNIDLLLKNLGATSEICRANLFSISAGRPPPWHKNGKSSRWPRQNGCRQTVGRILCTGDERNACMDCQVLELLELHFEKIDPDHAKRGLKRVVRDTCQPLPSSTEKRAASASSTAPRLVWRREEWILARVAPLPCLRRCVTLIQGFLSPRVISQKVFW
jgi:hypothetical protein